MADVGALYEWMETIASNVEKGTAHEKTAAAVRAISAHAKVAIGLWRILPGGEVDGVKVSRVVIKVAPRSPDKVMLVVQGSRGRKNLVAFHTGAPGAELFDQFVQRAMAGSVSWREDTPYVDAVAGPEVESLPALGEP